MTLSVPLRRRWALALLAGVLLSACVADGAPSATVPELRAVQVRVDDAVRGEDWVAARSGIDELVALAEAAGGDGRLPTSQVADVVTAAEALAVTLPGEPAADEAGADAQPSASASATSSPSSPPASPAPSASAPTPTAPDKDKDKDIADLGSLPRGRAVLIASGAPPVLIETLPWMTGPHAGDVRASIAAHDPAAPVPPVHLVPAQPQLVDE